MIVKIFLIYSVVAAIVALRFGYLAAVESDGNRKGQARLIAYLLFSSWFCLSPIVWFIRDRSLPVYEFHGTIESVAVHNGSNKYYNADLHIRTTLGGIIDVHTGDRSDYLRPGQILDVQYRGDTGDLIRADFYSSDGKLVGTLHRAIWLNQTVLFIIGLFCIWASIRKYRRDPNGSET